MPTKAKPKTREERIAERGAEIDAIQQMNAAHQAERAEREREHNAFMQRVQQGRDRVESFVQHSFVQRADDSMTPAQLDALHKQIQDEAYERERTMFPAPPSLADIYAAKAAEEQAAEEEAERQRIAALTPREIWMSTLPWNERAHIQRWEAINRMPWPYAPV